METFVCHNGCCKIMIKTYKESFDSKIRGYKKKAGVFIYDPNTNKVLIVQSRGNLWGAPKGAIENGETNVECAIREVKEETGLIICEENLTRSVIICNQATYFYLEMGECDVKIEENCLQNDATGIGWIKLECLKKYIKLGNLNINQHFRILLLKLLE
jgi:8-oxo-dGTP pyrophosphatase MutT (NUDIX family)